MSALTRHSAAEMERVMVDSSILDNRNLKEISSMGNFHVLEHQRDLSVSDISALNQYFAAKMNTSINSSYGT